MKKHAYLVLILALLLLFASCEQKPVEQDPTQNTSTTASETESESTPSEENPTESIPFPSFDALNCHTLVTLGDTSTLAYSADTLAHAVKNLYDTYYKEYNQTITNRAAQAGDLVNIDYAGYLDGVAFQGGTATNQTVFIVGDSGYIPGFVEGIPTHTVGEEFDVPVTFPENYGKADLAGKAVIFKMKLNAIYDLTLTDATVKELTKNEFESYNALLQEYKKKEGGSELLQALAEKSTFLKIPAESYLFFADYYRNMYRNYAAYYGMEYEEFLAMNGLSDAKLDEAAKDQAKLYITAYALAKAHSFEIDAETMSAEWESYIQRIMTEKSCSRAEAEAMVASDEKDMLKADLTYRAALNWLTDQVN